MLIIRCCARFTSAGLGRSALHIAVFARQFEAAELLVQRGCKLSPRLKDGRTVLMLAAQYACVDIAKLVLRRNIELKAEAEAEAAQEDRGSDGDGGDVETLEAGSTMVFYQLKIEL